MRTISPSLLSADFTRLDQQLALMEKIGAKRLHLDVMDGHFVPNFTFGPFIIEAIRRLTTITLDSHLMMEKPHRYLKEFVVAGSDTVWVHAEASEDLRRDLATIHELGAGAGVAINPDTDFDTLRPYLSDLDNVLIMSVFPGFGGQAFIESTLENMRKAVAARRDHDFLIAVDGGVNLTTIDRVFDAGVDIAVVGSGLFDAPDIQQRYRELQGPA
ncbi:MAG: ribulose-phosphate 3-epimerase [Candidatus Neomarinimicrobiota bacterium]